MFVFWTAVDDWIGDVGARLIAEGLEMNTSVKKLLLRSVFHPCYSSCIASKSLVFDMND